MKHSTPASQQMKSSMCRVPRGLGRYTEDAHLNSSPVCYFFFFSPQERVFLCGPGCPGTHGVDQAGLELRPASASGLLELKMCVATVKDRLEPSSLPASISKLGL